jgi:hypothetical protein
MQPACAGRAFPRLRGLALIGVYSMLFYLPIYAVLWQPSSKLFAVSRAELLFQGFIRAP